MRTNELILYRHMGQENILRDMSFLMENFESGFYNPEDMRGMLFEAVSNLMELSASHGFEGNLWHTYLTYLLVSDENAYSTACEIVGPAEGSINRVAEHDFAIFKELFDYDFQPMQKRLRAECLDILFRYQDNGTGGKMFNARIRDRVCELARSLEQAEDVKAFKAIMTEFYKEFGVGKFGLHKAFRIEHIGDKAEIVPVTKIAHMHLDDLVGYEMAKEKLIQNTEAFVDGRRANNCLLFEMQGPENPLPLKRS